VVTPGQQRAAADYLCERYQVSQRRASRVLDRARSTLRYRRRQRSGEGALVRAIQRLARRHPRFGYKRIHVRLVKQGWRVNLKRTRRLWQALGLRRPFRRKKPRKRGPKPGTSANSCVNQPARFKNDVWTYDFIADRTAAGGTLKCLSLVDEYTRECLALHPAASMTGSEVRHVLARVIGRRGAPTRIRSDNGSEFICTALAEWLPRAGAKSIPVAPASPWQNGYIESFHSRLRDEFLNAEEFESAADAQEKARWWRREYNTLRPHSGLRYKTPKEFSAECDRGQHGQPSPRADVNGLSCVVGTPISGGPKNG
jgi:putative transposase